jgi:hypothetical protein
MFCPFRNGNPDCSADCAVYIKELESCAIKDLAVSFNILIQADEEPEQETKEGDDQTV